MRIPKYSAVVGVVSILVGLLVFASCGRGEKAANKQAEAVAEKILKATTGKDAKVEIDGKSVKIKGEGFKHDLTQTTEWPADIFAGVPEFTFGKIERVSKGEEGGMMKFNIYLTDIEQGGVERYVNLLKEAGWQADFVGGPQGGLVSGQKGELGLNFVLNTEDGSGMLAVFSGMKQ
jgi:hypothetical protein